MSSHTVLFLAPLTEFSGNKTTADRIRSYFLAANYKCLLADCKKLTCAKDLQSYVEENQVSVVIGLHAYRSGKLLIGCEKPYSIIFGGTDINVFCDVSEQYEVMSQVTEGASYLVGFTDDLLHKAKAAWPTLPEAKFKKIAHGISVRPSEINFLERLKTFNASIGSDAIIFLLVAGIRPVKDVMFLVEEFSNWHNSKMPKAWLIIQGPVLDQSYGSEAIEKIKGLPGVVYIGSQDQSDTHAAMSQSQAVLNTSLSEGMPQAILEAMALGVPVLVRKIPGNEAVVEHGATGLVFDTPQAFIQEAEKLLADAELQKKLIRAAKAQVERNHNCDTEQEAYLEIVRDMLRHESVIH